MKLHELKKGQQFKVVGEDTIYTFHGMDGMYAKVTWQGMHQEIALLGNPMLKVEVQNDNI